MNNKARSEEIFEKLGDHLECPFCGYLNPYSRAQCMLDVEAWLCRRCQKIFPLSEGPQ